MIELTELDARVIGVLIEKEKTTPDQYPLSVNGLTVACNQKSNREPVMSLSESEVLDVLDGLLKKNLVSEVVFGSRVKKYKHRFCNTEFSKLKLSSGELGIVCVMLLRGAQTPGELRSRTQRLCEFSSVAEVESTLEALMSRDTGALVARLEREPGKRESRYIQLFSPVEEPIQAASEPDSTSGVAVDMTASARVEALEAEVKALREDVEMLKDLLS